MPMKQGNISKAELAQMYRPDVSLSVAKKWLRRQLYLTPGLLVALKATGYKNTQKLFTPKQIEVIYEKIGAP